MRGPPIPVEVGDLLDGPPREPIDEPPRQEGSQAGLCGLRAPPGDRSIVVEAPVGPLIPRGRAVDPRHPGEPDEHSENPDEVDRDPGRRGLPSMPEVDNTKVGGVGPKEGSEKGGAATQRNTAKPIPTNVMARIERACRRAASTRSQSIARSSARWPRKPAALCESCGHSLRSASAAWR